MRVIGFLLVYSTLAMMSVSRNKKYSFWSASSTLVPPNSGSKTWSPTFTPIGMFSPAYKKRRLCKFSISCALLCHPYLISRSWSDGNDCALENFRLCLLWNDDSTGGLCQCFSSLDENAVEQWEEFLCNSGLQITK
jgi:hypothetical protein